MKKLTKGIVIGIVLILVLILGANSLFTVREDQYACTVRFSKIIDTTSEAGLHFKVPFLDSVKYFSKATMLYDIPPSEVLTSDKQNMTVDCYVLWQISDPLRFYQTLGSTSVAEQRLDALTYNALKNVMGTLAQADIINMEDGAKRNDIYSGIATTVDALAQTYGIHVLDVKIKQFDLPESNMNAVYSRMISERNQMAEKYTADGNYEASIIRNEVDKQVNIMISDARAEAAKLEAEGEAEYMRLLAEAYNTPDKQEFYEFILALDALEKSLTGDEKTVILDADSELAQILTGAKYRWKAVSAPKWGGDPREEETYGKTGKGDPGGHQSSGGTDRKRNFGRKHVRFSGGFRRLPHRGCPMQRAGVRTLQLLWRQPGEPERDPVPGWRQRGSPVRGYLRRLPGGVLQAEYRGRGEFSGKIGGDPLSTHRPLITKPPRF